MKIQNHNQLSCTNPKGAIFPANFKINKVIFTILFSLYLALSLICFIWPNNLITFINTLLGLFAFILLSIRIRREYVPIYIFVGFLAVSFFISSIYVSRTGWRLYFPLCFIVSSPGIAMILFRRYVYSWGGYIVFYGLTGYFLMLMLAGVDGNSALKYSSFNGISQVMLVACVSLYIILSMENKKIDFKPALFTLFISIWGIGRSGIVASSVLIFGLLFIWLRANPKYIYKVIYCLFIICLLYFLFTVAMDYDIISNAIDHYLARKTGPSERWKMWMNYINNLDIFRVMFGVNVEVDPWPEGLIMAYNYHNSIINLHLQTGFMGLITLALIIFSFFKFYRVNQVFFVLFLSIFIRCFVDSFIFFGPWDYILFFFIFDLLKRFRIRVPHGNPPFCRYQRAGLGKL